MGQSSAVVRRGWAVVERERGEVGQEAEPHLPQADPEEGRRRRAERGAGKVGRRRAAEEGLLW